MPGFLRRQSAHSDLLGRYYTPDLYSRILVNAIDYEHPKLVVELGAGKGILSTAAMQKWRQSSFITVDVDSETSKHINNPIFQKKHKHHNHDVLDYMLNKSIGVKLGSADVGVCNPPFIRPVWREEFRKILSEASLLSPLKSITDAGADLLFVAQNLRLLKQNGKLGLVLPDGLIAGEKFRNIRQSLLNEHLIEQVVQLPKNAFVGAEAQTYLVVLTKNAGPTKEIKLTTFKNDGLSTDIVIIPSNSGVLRLDYKYHKARSTGLIKKTESSSLKLESFCLDLKRGTLNSNEIRKFSIPTFHLDNFPKSGTSGIITIPRGLHIGNQYRRIVEDCYLTANAGDILLARVGRNLHEKVCLIKQGRCIISDCIFRIQVNSEYRLPVYNYLKSEEGEEVLRTMAHGVGANYIGRKDVLNLSIPIKFLVH